MNVSRKGGCSEHDEGELNKIGIIWLASVNKGYQNRTHNTACRWLLLDSVGW